MKKIILITLVFIITSCAVNRKIKYDGLQWDVSKVQNKELLFALLDHRAQVIDGSRNPDFVGYMRSNVGIAYPMGTQSKNDFINDLSQNLINSLDRFDIKATCIKTNFTDDEKVVKSTLLSSSGNKKILLVFDELHTDGYAIQLLHYKINVFVYNKTGELLKFKRFEGERKLGGTVAFGAGPYKKYMPQSISKLFEEIFNNEELLTQINSK